MAVSGTRKAKVELTADSKGMDAGLKEASRKMRMFARDELKVARQAYKAIAREQREAQRDAHGGASKGIGALKAAGFGIAAAAGFDVAGGIGSLVTSVFDAEKELTRFGIDAQVSGNTLNQFRADTLAASEATGVSRIEIMKGAHAYQILTGDAKGAMMQSRLFADVMNATGTSMEDTAAVAASLQKNLGFDPADFRKGFDIISNMGHRGAVEMRDLAGEMSGLAPQMKEFDPGATPEKHLLEMTGALEVMRNNFGSASETATGFRSLMNGLVKPHSLKALEGLGIQVFTIDPKTKKHIKRDFLDIVQDIIRNPAVDDKMLPKLLGRTEGIRALDAMRDHWNELQDLMKGGAESNQIMKDSQTYMESTSGRLQIAWEHIRNAMAEAMTPDRIDKVTGALVTAADAAVKLIGFLSTIASLTSSAVGDDGLGAGLGRTMIGESWDSDEMKERQKEADRAQARQDRAGALYDAANPKGGTAAARDAYIRQTVGQEEILKEQLATQRDGGTISRKSWVDTGEMSGQMQVNRGNFSVAELSKLGQLEKGATNTALPKMIAQLIGVEVGRAMKRITDSILGGVPRGSTTGLQNEIAGAAGKAGVHSRKPGPGRT